MIFLRNILLGGIFLITIVLLLTTMGSDPNTDEAQLFLNKLKEGEASALITQFGDNTCHCQPRGGYQAYLKYQSGESENLAYLFGHKFSIGAMSSREVPTVEKVKGGYMAWESPESTEVDVQVSFNPAEYSPYLLPRDMAYGYTMKEADLLKFCAEPRAETEKVKPVEFFRDITLCLRPSLEKGLVPPPAPPDKNRKPEYMSDFYLQLLSGDDAKYLRPADAGNVETDSGKSASAVDFAQKLPRLKSGVLRVSVVRRGKMQRWAVKKVRLKDPVFTLSNGKELALKTPEEALADKQKLMQDQEHEEETPQHEQ